jgi:hypothetical protein
MVSNNSSKVIPQKAKLATPPLPYGLLWSLDTELTLSRWRETSCWWEFRANYIHMIPMVKDLVSLACSAGGANQSGCSRWNGRILQCAALPVVEISIDVEMRMLCFSSSRWHICCISSHEGQADFELLLMKRNARSWSWS